MKQLYQTGEKVLYFKYNELIECKIYVFVPDANIYLVYVEGNNGYSFNAPEDSLYGIKELRKSHKELEAIILMEKSDLLDKIIRDSKIFTKLLQIENFLCENDPEMKR